MVNVIKQHMITNDYILSLFNVLVACIFCILLISIKKQQKAIITFLNFTIIKAMKIGNILDLTKNGIFMVFIDQQRLENIAGFGIK